MWVIPSRPCALTFSPLAFTKKDGKQQVMGLVEGLVTHTDGSKETFTALRTLKVKSINGKSLSGLTSRSAAEGLMACNILHLVLGPLDLNLLGLTVHLDKVVLDITAVPGAGACWATCSARSPACSTAVRWPACSAS